MQGRLAAVGALAGQGSHLGTDRAGAAHEALPGRWEGVVAGSEPQNTSQLGQLLLGTAWLGRRRNQLPPSAIGRAVPSEQRPSACNLLVWDMPPARVPAHTSSLGFLPCVARFCLENTDPRTRGRGIQLLSQVLLECHSLLQEKEGKGCSAPCTGCWQAGGPESLSCTQQTGCFSTVAALRASLEGQSPRRTRGLTLQPVCHPPDTIWAWLCSWCTRQRVGVAYPGVLSATWEASGTHLHVRIPAW